MTPFVKFHHEQTKLNTGIPESAKKKKQHLNNKEYCNSRCMMQILKLGRQTKQKKTTQK